VTTTSPREGERTRLDPPPRKRKQRHPRRVVPLEQQWLTFAEACAVAGMSQSKLRPYLPEIGARMTAFLRFLNRVAEALKCTVILITHPSRTSDGSVERLQSGSTSWTFQARFGLLLKKADDEEEAEAVSLILRKANYRKPGLTLDLAWTDDGVLTHIPAKDTVDSIQDKADERRLLSVIDIRWNKADAEPYRKNSGPTLRIVMAREPVNWKARRTEKCIERLQLAGWVGYRDGGGRRGWYVTEDGKKQVT